MNEYFQAYIGSESLDIFLRKFGLETPFFWAFLQIFEILKKFYLFSKSCSQMLLLVLTKTWIQKILIFCLIPDQTVRILPKWTDNIGKIKEIWGKKFSSFSEERRLQLSAGQTT